MDVIFNTFEMCFSQLIAGYRKVPFVSQGSISRKKNVFVQIANALVHFSVRILFFANILCIW